MEAQTGKGQFPTAPDFALQDTDGKTHRLSDYKGSVVVLNFFGLGCVPCDAEAPHIQSLWERYKEKGVKFFAVNAWRQPSSDCQTFKQRHKLTFPVLVDERGIVTERYGVTYVPYLVLIDRNGRIRFAGGELDKMVQTLSDLVAEK